MLNRLIKIILFVNVACLLPQAFSQTCEEAFNLFDKGMKKAEAGNFNGTASSEAGQYFIQAAELGHPQAQYIAGMLFLNENITKATEFLEKASEQGQAQAQFELGFLYLSGGPKGVVSVNLGKARELLEKAAEQNHPEALYNLSVMHSRQKEEHSLKKSLELLEKAVELGHIEAHNNLAVFYMSKGNDGKARELLEKAVNANNQPSNAILWNLSQLYLKQGEFDKGYPLLKKLAEHGHPQAQHNLATLLIKAQGVKQNLKEARSWLTKAYEHGSLLESKRVLEALDAYEKSDDTELLIKKAMINVLFSPPPSVL